MRRREFLGTLSTAALAQNPGATASLNASAEAMFLEILHGYVASTARTSDSYAAVEFPDATVTRSFLTKSGLSVTGVTRMLPALAAWIVAKRQPGILSIEGKKYDLLDVTGSAIINGTNPTHKDYWQPASGSQQDQRQVEAALVAWSAWLLRDTLLPQLSSAERSRLDQWLASCTAVPGRKDNWAWFTAVNHAARLALKDRFDEFSYDQRSMFDDLRAIDAMHAGGGWYNNSKQLAAFDYYNSWVFASHFLYWNAMAGGKFPDWSKLFSERLSQYLTTAPLFFGANGSYVLYGRSLLYRWAVLTPLILSYQQKLWPHDASMLHRIVRLSLEFHKNTGAFDSSKGKLREAFSDRGTADIRESYIDGGHPYYCMQAFIMWLIPREDPFWWTEGQLPVEQRDFRHTLEAPGLMVAGLKSSGQVKLLQARSSAAEVPLRDKYNKFTYSSHFPMDVVQRADVCAWDNALVLRDRRKRKSAGRGDIQAVRLLPDGMELTYGIEYAEVKASVRSTFITDGEWEIRVHRVTAPNDIDPGVELVEGSSALGIDNADDAEHSTTDTYSIVRNRRTGMLIGTWPGSGWSGVGAAWDFGSEDSARSNVIYSRMEVNTIWTAVKPGVQVVSAVHYASPRPLAAAALQTTASRLLARARIISGGMAPPAAPVKKRR